MVSSQAPVDTHVKGAHWFEVDGLALPRAVGGHPALDFVNTWAGWGEVPSVPEGSEFLKTYDHLAAWASVSGLVEADSASALRRRARSRKAEAEAILKDARRFRTDLHSLVLDPSDPSALRGVNTVVLRAAAHAELTPVAGARATGAHAGHRWMVGGGLERPLLAVAWAASDLLTQHDLTDIGTCPGDHCGWVFLDPRGRRRWCSMQWCGNRAKVRAHAERHRV